MPLPTWDKVVEVATLTLTSQISASLQTTEGQPPPKQGGTLANFEKIEIHHSENEEEK